MTARDARAATLRSSIAWILSMVVVVLVLGELASAERTRLISLDGDKVNWTKIADPDVRFALVAGQLGVDENGGCPRLEAYQIEGQDQGTDAAPHCEFLGFRLNPYKDAATVEKIIDEQTSKVAGDRMMHSDKAAANDQELLESAQTDNGIIQRERNYSDIAVIWALLFTVIGTIVIFRGKSGDMVSLWLGVFCLAEAPQMLQRLGFFNPLLRLELSTLLDALQLLAWYALFEMSAALLTICGSGMKRALPLLRGVALALIAVQLGACIIDNVAAGAALTSRYPVSDAWYRGFYSIAQIVVFFVLPPMLLISAMATARDAQHRRSFTIIFAAVAIGLLGAAKAPFLSLATKGFGASSDFMVLTLGLIPVGFALAIPTFRVVNIGLANSIAWIVASTVLAGVLAGVELSAERVAEITLPERRMLFQLLTAFAIIMIIGLSHERLVERIKGLVFQRREEALHKLAKFSRRAHSMPSVDSLLAGLHAVLVESLETPVSIYCPRRDHPGEFVRSYGEGLPKVLHATDPLAIDLRDSGGSRHMRYEAEHDRPVGHAFPLEAGGVHFGFIVMNERQDEVEGRLSKEEIAAVMRTAETVAEALLALEAKESKAFVSDVALGRVAGEAVMERARRLAGFESPTVPDSPPVSNA